MQLLEMLNKLCAIAFILSTSMEVTLADTQCDHENETNDEIIVCSQRSLDNIDKILRRQYKALSSELGPLLRTELWATQEKWSIFKKDYCDEGSDEDAGREDPIDKISCVTQLTSFRLSEIIYLRTGVIGDGFYKAVSVVNKKVTAMNYSNAVKYVGGDINFGEPWKEYAEKNCLMTNKMFGEPTERCMQRMRFQIPIY